MFMSYSLGMRGGLSPLLLVLVPYRIGREVRGVYLERDHEPLAVDRAPDVYLTFLNDLNVTVLVPLGSGSVRNVNPIVTVRDPWRNREVREYRFQVGLDLVLVRWDRGDRGKGTVVLDSVVPRIGP